MLKPDFGRVVDRRIEWTKERIDWVRHLAEDKHMSAPDIAEDIGLARNQAPRIYELCKRCNIALSGQGGRVGTKAEAAVFSVAVRGHNADLLSRVAKRHALPAGKIAEMLLNACFETGEPFCDNLLDLYAGT